MSPQERGRDSEDPVEGQAMPLWTGRDACTEYQADHFFSAEDSIALLAVDPYWLLAYWTVHPRSLELARARVGDRAARTAIRFHEVALAEFDGSNATNTFDILPEQTAEAAGRVAGNYYLSLWSPGKSLVAELGVKGEDGRFSAIVRSNFLALPNDAESRHYDERLRRVRGDASGRWGVRISPPIAAFQVADAALASDVEEEGEGENALDRQAVPHERPGTTAPPSQGDAPAPSGIPGTGVWPPAEAPAFPRKSPRITPAPAEPQSEEGPRVAGRVPAPVREITPAGVAPRELHFESPDFSGGEPPPPQESGAVQFEAPSPVPPTLPPSSPAAAPSLLAAEMAPRETEPLCQAADDAERVILGISSGVQAGVGPSSGQVSSFQRRPRDEHAHLEVQADIVIYGSALPGTQVVIDGVVVSVRGDGTFDLRFTLSPGAGQDPGQSEPGHLPQGGPRP